MILSSAIDLSNPYLLIIGASLIVILSYFFNLIGKKTNIPSVLLLIATGIVINQVFFVGTGTEIDFMPALEILGILGLIMIVLEAALDLELSREKLPLIFKTLLVDDKGLNNIVGDPEHYIQGEEIALKIAANDLLINRERLQEEMLSNSDEYIVEP